MNIRDIAQFRKSNSFPCYCIMCDQYFDHDLSKDNTVRLVDSDHGICEGCLEKEDPKLMIEGSTDFIKEFYIVRPEKFSEK